MKPEEFHKGWRQVRVFTRGVQQPNWYAAFLGSVVKPVADAFPNTLLFISRYGVAEGQDDADTKIKDLPPDFLFQFPNDKKGHVSVRIRFHPVSDEEKQLTTLITGDKHLWFSEFLDFGMPGGLAGDRFATNQNSASLMRRGEMVTRTLCANSRLILDTLVQNNEQWEFEANSHDLNRLIGTVGQSVVHMVVNPWSLPNSNPLPFYIRTNDTFFVRL